MITNLILGTQVTSSSLTARHPLEAYNCGFSPVFRGAKIEKREELELPNSIDEILRALVPFIQLDLWCARKNFIAIFDIPKLHGLALTYVEAL